MMNDLTDDALAAQIAEEKPVIVGAQKRSGCKGLYLAG